MDTPRSPSAHPIGRAGLTGSAARSLQLSVPASLLSLAVWAGIILVPLGGIGSSVLARVVPALEAVGDRQRRLAEAGLGRPVTRTYADATGRSALATVGVWSRDPGRWRDFAWSHYSWSIGLALSALTVSLLLYPLWAVVWFFLWLGLPDVFGNPLGFLTIDTVWGAALYAVVTSLVAVGLWALLVKPVERLRLRWDARLLGDSEEERLRRRVLEVTTSRDESVDASAAELRRVERDLHDGPQARLAALAMNLGLAEELVDADPETVRALLKEAREGASGALGDLRAVVRGIHPPVLADRGLEEAIRALAIDLATPVSLDLRIAERLPAQMESALYFSVAECLANMSKHSGASRAWVTTRRSDGLLHLEVGDDGRGGAVAAGTGLQGVARRLAALDGRMDVSSPRGGPTVITMEVPCASSSARTTPFSGTV